MADHPHTVDRWDDATGENVIEQIAAVGDYLVYGRRCNAGLTPKSRSATGRGCSRTAILAGRKWTAATRVQEPKPHTAGVSASEHNRARATVEQLQAAL